MSRVFTSVQAKMSELKGPNMKMTLPLHYNNFVINVISTAVRAIMMMIMKVRLLVLLRYRDNGAGPMVDF